MSSTHQDGLSTSSGPSGQVHAASALDDKQERMSLRSSEVGINFQRSATPICDPSTVQPRARMRHTSLIWLSPSFPLLSKHRLKMSYLTNDTVQPSPTANTVDVECSAAAAVHLLVLMHWPICLRCRTM